MVKNLKCISRLNIHYYPNRRYKSYITSSKGDIAGKSLMSSGLDIYRILHFIFCDKILQIYRQHWVRKCYRHILSKYRQITKKWESGVGVCVCVCVWGGVGGEWRGAKLTHTPPLNTPLLIPLDLDDAIVASSGQITTVMIWDGTLLKTNIGRSSPPDVFLGTSVLKICSKFTREHP